jgi:hypothetical protein
MMTPDFIVINAVLLVLMVVMVCRPRKQRSSPPRALDRRSRHLGREQRRGARRVYGKTLEPDGSPASDNPGAQQLNSVEPTAERTNPLVRVVI